jgi:2-alkenal reductase
LGFEAVPERYNRRLGIKEGQIAVLTVRNGGPADRAGLRPADRRTGELGDIIIGINDGPASGWERLLDLAYNMPIGETLMLEVQRNGRTAQLRLRVEAQ